VLLQVEGIRIDARSLGGIATAIAFPEWSLAVDLGACTPAALRCENLALTHAHADHLAGLHQWLGVRRLYGMRPPRIVMPEALLPLVTELVDVLGRLQGRLFDVTLQGVPTGGEVELGRDLRLRSFPVVHGVPSTGWLVLRRVQKLREPFRGLPGPEIARMKAEGVPDLFEDVEDPLVAVTGDTQADGLDLAADPAVARARVLMLETTFLDHERRDSNAARVGMHVHLDDLPGLLRGIQARAVVLYHVSQVYRRDEVEAAIRGHLPEEWRNRVHVVVPEDAERL
jgi:ribonuclease Z